MEGRLLDGKVVFVTGGAGLLGREFCRAIQASGGVPVVADRCAEAAEALAGELPGPADFANVDITDRASLLNAIGEIHGRHGRVDALVNSAYPRNPNYGRHFFEVEYADFCENLSLHLGGYFLACQQFAAYFKEQGSGNIVNVASIYGVVAPRFELYEGTEMTMPVEYAAIKAGVIHLTKYLARYLKGTGIRVNAISPGGILQGQPESFLARYREQCLTKGMLDPSDVVGTLVYLLSPQSERVNGQNLVLDDGFCL